MPKKKVTVNSNISTGSNMISDKREIAKTCNRLFVNVGNCISHLEKQNFNSLNTLSHVKSTFKFKVVDSETVKRELENIDVNKPIGLDDLHPRLLKFAAPFYC